MKVIDHIKKKIETYTKAQRKNLWEEEHTSRKISGKTQNSNCLICSIIIAFLCMLSVVLSVIVFQQHKTINALVNKTTNMSNTNNKVGESGNTKASVTIEPKVEVRPSQVSSSQTSRTVNPKASTKMSSKSSK